MPRSKTSLNKRDREPPNYVGWMRSKSNFEVIEISNCQKTEIMQNNQIVFSYFPKKYLSQIYQNVQKISQQYALRINVELRLIRAHEVFQTQTNKQTNRQTDRHLSLDQGE